MSGINLSKVAYILRTDLALNGNDYDDYDVDDNIDHDDRFAILVLMLMATVF